MDESNRRNRFAFTFLELLIAIAIVGVLLAMIIPAVASVREAARRTSCLNNMRQQVLGILNFESAFQQLPSAAGFVRGEEDLPETTESYSGFLSFFNQMERYEGPYYSDVVEFEGKTFPAYPDVDAHGYPLWSQQRHWLICPSLPMPESEFAVTHYAFSIGDAAKNINNPSSIRGAFAVGMTLKVDEVVDGTTQTIAMTEIGGVGGRSVGSRFAINQPRKYLDKPSLTSELANSNRFKSTVTLSNKTRGGNWADGTAGAGLVKTILPPGSPSVLVGESSEVNGFLSASVNHPGGTNVALLDGSTRVIDADIDTGDQNYPANSAKELEGVASHYGVWGALGSSNGEETDFEF